MVLIILPAAAGVTWGVGSLLQPALECWRAVALPAALKPCNARTCNALKDEALES
mgnify:CR=1 FL=1